MLREKAMKLLAIPFYEKYLFSWLKEILFPLGILFSLSLAVLYREKKYKLLFIVFFSVGLFNNSLTIAKAPIAMLFFMLIAYYFVYKQNITLKILLISFFTVFMIPFFIIYFGSIPEIRHPGHIMTSLFTRVFVVPAEAVFQYFKIFPDMYDFLYGRSSNLFSWLHAEGNFKTSNFVAKIWWNDPHTTGSANAIYIGNFWADFGLAGVLASGFFFGFFSHYVYQRIIITAGYEKNIIYMSFVSLLIMDFTFTFISSSITTFFLTKGIIVLIFLLYMIRLYKQKIKDNR